MMGGHGLVVSWFGASGGALVLVMAPWQLWLLVSTKFPGPSLTAPPLAPCPLQIAEVINERKLAITLSGFINQIFDKALTETHFAELYADLVAA